MRQGARGVFTTCNAPLPLGRKYVAVQLLSSDTLYFSVDVKAKIQDVLDQLCNYLGLNDAQLFGLALLVDGEYQFVDQTTKLSKCAPKSWKGQHNAGLDDHGKPLLLLYLRVQFYVDCLLLIRDKVTRNQYYHQLRQNVPVYNQALSEERAFLLAAFALQADLGNFNPEKHHGRYFDPNKYFPSWIIQTVGLEYIIQHAPAMHKDNYELSRGEAQISYIREASDSSSPHNLHLYRVYRKKSKTSRSQTWLGICPKGIEIYEENNLSIKTPLSTFLWSDIGKLCFEKKKFEIRSIGCRESRRFTYLTSSETMARSLLWLCRLTHQFRMALQPRLQELQKLEMEVPKKYRESYIYSDSLDLAWEKGLMEYNPAETLPPAAPLLKKSGNSANSSDQRISVISSTSSNTTSGIVSDKVQSFDESEDDLDMEIMINTPPAASMESLPTGGSDYGTMESLRKKLKPLSLSEYSLYRDSSKDNHQITYQDDLFLAEKRSAPRTPTSSLLSGSSMASYTDSTTSSASQLSAVTVKSFVPVPQSVLDYCNREAPKPKLVQSKHLSIPNQNSPSNKATKTQELKLVQSSSKHNLSPQYSKELDAGSNTSLPSVPYNCSNNKKVLIHRAVSQPPTKATSLDNIALSNASLYHEESPRRNLYSNKLKIVSCAAKATSHDSLPSQTLSTFGGTKPQVSSSNNSSRTCIPHGVASSVISSSQYCPVVTSKPVSMCRPGNSSKPVRSSESGFAPSLTNSTHVPTESYVTRDVPSVRPESFHEQKKQNTVYTVHVQNDPNASQVPHYGRNATRIGVSSLTRTQKVPLSLFNNWPAGVGMAISEPNLYNSQLCYGPNQGAILNSVTGSGDSVKPSVPLSVSGAFPCIPPPPAYRTENTNGFQEDQPIANGVYRGICSPVTSKADLNKIQGSNGSSEVLNSKEPNENQNGNEQLSQKTRKEGLDLQQLREKSKDLDLPLITALCNDRSLLMLPKTVPTCSRQRHMAGCKDLRRFSCSYLSPDSEEKQLQDYISNKKGLIPGHRPISWHLDAGNNPLKANNSQTLVLNNNNTNKKIQTSILTSFGKSAEKHSTSLTNGSPSRQMIPTKLSSGCCESIANSCISTKRLSS